MTLPAFLLDPLKFKNPVRIINSKSTFFYSRHSSVGLLGSLTVTITGRFPCPTQLFNAYYCSPDYSYCVPFLRPLLFLLQKREAPLYVLLSNSRARTGRNIFGQQQLNPTTLYNRLNRKFERSHNQTRRHDWVMIAACLCESVSLSTSRTEAMEQTCEKPVVVVIM